MNINVAVLGPGRIGRQIALAFALGGSRVSLVDVKERPAVAPRRCSPTRGAKFDGTSR